MGSSDKFLELFYVKKPNLDRFPCIGGMILGI